MSEAVMLEHEGKVDPEVGWIQAIKGFLCDTPYLEPGNLLAASGVTAKMGAICMFHLTLDNY